MRHTEPDASSPVSREPIARWLHAGSWLERLAQITLAVAVLWGIGKTIGVLAPVLSPVLVSLLIAYLLDPLIDRFEQRGVNRTLAISLVFAVALGGIALLVAFIAPVLFEQSAAALRALPELARREYDHLDQLLQQRFGFALESRFEDIANFVATRSQAAISSIAEASLSSVGTILNAVILPIFTFYFLRDFDRLKRLPLLFVPPRWHERFEQRAARMDSLVGEWVRGQVQVALILAALYSIGLSIAGVRLGFAIGLVAGLLNIVPYLGAILGFALSVLMAVIYGESVVGELIGIGVVFAIVQGLEGYLITPRLVGEKVGMSPLTVMIVLLLGGSLFGFFGLLLAIPCVAAGSVLLHDLLNWYRSTDFYREAPIEPLATAAFESEPGGLAAAQPLESSDLPAATDVPASGPGPVPLTAPSPDPTAPTETAPSAVSAPSGADASAATPDASPSAPDHNEQPS